MTSDTVKITIIVNNQAKQNLVAEHGFSLWIETENQCILFDAGQGKALQENAQSLGLHIEKTDFLIISHGHYDHTGKIPWIIQQAGNVHVFCHPGIIYPRYSRKNGQVKSIKMPLDSVNAINQLPSFQLHWVHRPTMFIDNAGVTGEIPRKTKFEDTGGDFYLNPKSTRPDLINDEIALWIRTAAGLIIFSGCSHAGLINTINCVQQINYGMKIIAVIGGFHLLNASSERLQATAHALRSMHLDTLICCHCTGENAYQYLLRESNKEIISGEAGQTYLF